MSLVIKAGQSITTYHKSWLALFAKAIKLFTGEKRDHAIKVLAVTNIHVVIFETRLTSGATLSWVLKKDFLRRLSKAKVYVGDPLTPFKAEGLSYALDEAYRRHREKYGFWNMMREVWAINKIFEALKIKRNDQAFCSVLCAQMDSILFKDGYKILKKTDGYPSPLEYERITKKLGILEWKEIKDIKSYVG